MNLNIGEHYIVNLLGLDVHMDTLITLWLAMAVILVFALLSTIKINIMPNKLQGIFEKIVTIFVGLTKGMGKEQGSSALVLMCLFLLIIVSNLLGQVPLKIFHLPAGELAQWAQNHEPRGEYVIAVDMRQGKDIALSERDRAWLDVLAKELPPSRAAAAAARVTGLKRDEIYRLLNSGEA